jgi:hypothetical protein
MGNGRGRGTPYMVFITAAEILLIGPFPAFWAEGASDCSGWAHPWVCGRDANGTGEDNQPPERGYASHESPQARARELRTAGNRRSLELPSKCKPMACQTRTGQFIIGRPQRERPRHTIYGMPPPTFPDPQHHFAAPSAARYSVRLLSSWGSSGRG